MEMTVFGLLLTIRTDADFKKSKFTHECVQSSEVEAGSCLNMISTVQDMDQK